MVLQDSGELEIDGCTGTSTLNVVALSQDTMGTADGEWLHKVLMYAESTNGSTDHNTQCM
jgi:hypothetical protein